MEKLKFPVTITSVVLFLYGMSVVLNLKYPIIFWLFVLTNILFVWMVIRILKDGKPSEKTFDEAFYEDVD